MEPSDIPGQKELKDVFRQLVEDGRVPHAMLIHERPGGTGLALALYLSKMLLCNSRVGGDPCNECAQCLKVGQNAHPDLHYVFPNNTNAKVKKVEQRYSDSFYTEWREVLSEHPFLALSDWYDKIDIIKKQGFIGDEDITSLRKKLTLRSHGGGYRVFIIWHAEKMNASFANKILKNLEEPTPKTIFILITSSPSSLLPTITSRLQTFQESQLADGEIATMLQNVFNVDEKQSFTYAFRSEGNVSAAVKEALHDDEPWLDEFKQWMRMSYARDLSGLLRWSEAMNRKSRDEQLQFCQKALAVIDRCYRMGWVEEQIPMEGSEAMFFKDFSPFINTVNVSQFLGLLEQAAREIERNINGRIIWFDTSIKATRLVHYGRKATAQPTTK